MPQKVPPEQEQPLLHGTPPPYGASGYQYQDQPQGVAYVPHSTSAPVMVHSVPGTVVVVKERARCRFFQAFLLAILVWMLLGVFVKSASWNYGFGHGTPHVCFISISISCET